MRPKTKLITETAPVQEVTEAEPKIKELKFLEIDVRTNEATVNVYSEQHASRYRAFNATQSDDIKIQLDWLIAKWNTMIPTHWRYELAT